MLQYAHTVKNGENYMSAKEFVQNFLGMFPDGGNEQSIQLLAGIVDTSKDGLVEALLLQ